MNSIMQPIREIAGVQGVMLFDLQGNILFHDVPALFGVEDDSDFAASIVNTIEAFASERSDWDKMIANFSDGKLIFKNVNNEKILMVIGDSQINASYANIALNVARKKLLAFGADREQEKSSPSSTQVFTPPPVVESRKNDIVFSPASQAKIDFLTKHLALAIGPVARIIVKKAIRKLGVNGELSKNQLPEFIGLLEKSIDSSEARKQFRKAANTPLRI